MSAASCRGDNQIVQQMRRPLPKPVQLELEDPAKAQTLAEQCAFLYYQLGDPYT